MYRCLNPGAIGVNLGWEACLPLAKASGFEGIDVPVAADTDVGRCRELLAANGLKPGGMGLSFDFRAAEAAYQQGFAGFENIVKRSVAFGQKRFATWILSFSDDRPMKENFKFHVARLAPAAKVLAQHGGALGLEFLGPRSIREGHRYPFVRTLEQMLDLAAAVGPNVGLLLDSWHWQMSLGTVEDIQGLTPAQVVYVHINDAPPGIPIEQQQDLVRRVPGETGVEDLPGFLAALRQIKYDGPVVPEPFVPELSTVPPADAIQRVGSALKRVWSLPVRPALPAKMKAVAIGRRQAWLVDLPVPRPEGNEVIVKLHASPICGSNMGGYFGDTDCVNNGHEGAGEVVAVAQSNILKVGDRVALAPPIGCGRCADCLRGDIIFCRQRPPFHGTFAQFTRAADLVCTKIPDDLSYEHASLMGCALGPAYEAVKRLGVRSCDTVVITGLGPVGLGATALAADSGARVIALDPEPYRCGLAKKLGAAATLDPTAGNCREALLALTEGQGVHRGIDCSGKADSERLLLDLADVRAVIAFVGENAGTIPISPSRDFIRKGLTLLGCWHMNVLDAPDLVAFLRRQPAKAELLISHRFGFSQVQAAFEAFAGRQTAKVLLLPWQ